MYAGFFTSSYTLLFMSLLFLFYFVQLSYPFCFFSKSETHFWTKIKKKKDFSKLNCIFFFFCVHTQLRTDCPAPKYDTSFAKFLRFFLTLEFRELKVYILTPTSSHSNCSLHALNLQVNQSMQGDSRLDTSFTLIHSFQPNKLNVVCTELLHTCFCKYS